jgi:hypothetical protein
MARAIYHCRKPESTAKKSHKVSRVIGVSNFSLRTFTVQFDSPLAARTMPRHISFPSNPACRRYAPQRIHALDLCPLPAVSRSLSRSPLSARRRARTRFDLVATKL